MLWRFTQHTSLGLVLSPPHVRRWSAAWLQMGMRGTARAWYCKGVVPQGRGTARA